MDINQLRELYEKSTQGEWHIVKRNRVYAPNDILDGKFDRDDYEGYVSKNLTDNDAAFIAVVHNMMPEILKLVRKAEPRPSTFIGYQESLTEVCPVCSEGVDEKHDKYCKNCGQRLGGVYEQT
jgi:hypothetical protein